MKRALGTIEVIGLTAAIEAADVACKSADVDLVGYETTEGLGMVTVKIFGQVSAVQAAIQAASTAARAVSRVVACSVIPRPSDELAPIVLSPVTVGPRPAADEKPPALELPLAEEKPAAKAATAAPKPATASQRRRAAKPTKTTRPEPAKKSAPAKESRKDNNE
ncbi:MAG: BMC domain-containing protein [Arachnia sp.]